MNYSVTDTQLTGIADAIRAKTGGTAQLSFPDDFVSEIGTLTDTSDVNATAEYIHINKTAYVNGEKLTGTGRIIRTSTKVKTWPSSEKTVPVGGCIKQASAFQVESMRGIDTVSTTSSATLPNGSEFSYNQTTQSGYRYVHMYFNNLSSSSVTIPANAFTSTLTYIY